MQYLFITLMNCKIGSIIRWLKINLKRLKVMEMINDLKLTNVQLVLFTYSVKKTE